MHAPLNKMHMSSDTFGFLRRNEECIVEIKEKILKKRMPFAYCFCFCFDNEADVLMCRNSLDGLASLNGHTGIQNANQNDLN